MTTDVKTCRLDTNAAEAMRIMWEQDCGALPVLGHGARVVGMITDRDIAIAVGTRRCLSEQITVGEVMTGKVCTCIAEEDLVSALETMRTRQVRRLPVVDAEGRLVGILSINDIILRAGAVPSKQIVSALAGICERALKRPLTDAAA
ncbi:MAG: CBS domain-containing protein [Acidobacteria bacterium]|nr:CBS domain-containing protein [Acidobacteriota bacterium]